MSLRTFVGCFDDLCEDVFRNILSTLNSLLPLVNPLSTSASQQLHGLPHLTDTLLVLWVILKKC